MIRHSLRIAEVSFNLQTDRFDVWVIVVILPFPEIDVRLLFCYSVRVSHTLELPSASFNPIDHGVFDRDNIMGGS